MRIDLSGAGGHGLNANFLYLQTIVSLVWPEYKDCVDLPNHICDSVIKGAEANLYTFRE